MLRSDLCNRGRHLASSTFGGGLILTVCADATLAVMTMAPAANKTDLNDILLISLLDE